MENIERIIQKLLEALNHDFDMDGYGNGYEDGLTKALEIVRHNQTNQTKEVSELTDEDIEAEAWKRAKMIGNDTRDIVICKTLENFAKWAREKLKGSGWISVEDRLPDWDVQVLWLMDSNNCFIDDLDHDNTWDNFKLMHEGKKDDDFYFGDKITHWQPLPQPPKTKK